MAAFLCFLRRVGVLPFAKQRVGKRKAICVSTPSQIWTQNQMMLFLFPFFLFLPPSPPNHTHLRLSIHTTAEMMQMRQFREIGGKQETKGKEYRSRQSLVTALTGALLTTAFIVRDE